MPYTRSLPFSTLFVVHAAFFIGLHPLYLCRAVSTPLRRSLSMSYLPSIRQTVVHISPTLVDTTHAVPQSAIVDKEAKRKTWHRCSWLLHRLPPIYISKDDYAMMSSGPHQLPLTREHIVPQSVIRHSHKQNKTAISDLHNIFCCHATINRLRSNLPYSSTHPALGQRNATMRNVGFNNFIDMRKRLFVPEPQSRGPIARAILYMQHQYGCDPDVVIEGGEKTAWAWHTEHEADVNEKLHNYFVMKAGYGTNKFISNNTDVSAALDEILADMSRRRRSTTRKKSWRYCLWSSSIPSLAKW